MQLKCFKCLFCCNGGRWKINLSAFRCMFDLHQNVKKSVKVNHNLFNYNAIQTRSGCQLNLVNIRRLSFSCKFSAAFTQNQTQSKRKNRKTNRISTMKEQTYVIESNRIESNQPKRFTSSKFKHRPNIRYKMEQLLFIYNIDKEERKNLWTFCF